MHPFQVLHEQELHEKKQLVRAEGRFESHSAIGVRAFWTNSHVFAGLHFFLLTHLCESVRQMCSRPHGGFRKKRVLADPTDSSPTDSPGLCRIPAPQQVLGQQRAPGHGLQVLTPASFAPTSCQPLRQWQPKSQNKLKESQANINLDGFESFLMIF